MAISEEHKREFLCAFAEAILAWQYVENMLYCVFNNIFRHENPKLVSATFYAVISIDARLSMVDQAIKVVVTDKEMLDKWAKLLDKIRDKSRTRNKLAHLTVGHVSRGSNATELKLTAPGLKVSSTPAPEHNVKEIREFMESFSGLAENVLEFDDELEHYLDQQGASPRKLL